MFLQGKHKPYLIKKINFYSGQVRSTDINTNSCAINASN